MTSSLKTWWQGLKYWQKGGIIGVGVGIFLVAISPVAFSWHETYLGILYLPASFLIEGVLYQFLSKFSSSIASTYAILIFLLHYLLIGALIGLIIGKVKGK